MERTYERRRGTSPARGGRGKRQALDPREKRRLIQLGVSAGLFLLVFFGRGLVDAGRLADWKATLGQDTDFTGAFSQFGAALSRGEPVVDALGELWLEVFAGRTAPVDAPAGVWDKLPSFSLRMAEELRNPGDPVGRWTAEARRLWAAERLRDGAGESGGGGAFPTDAGPSAAARTLALRPLAATAQGTDQEGRRLPERVSLEYYDLGLQMLLPVSAPLTSGFGFRESPLADGDDFHLGADLGAAEGTKILACADGTVTFAGENSTYGNHVRIDHGGGVVTLYAHCRTLLVKEGQEVAAGETIAKVGHTGDATGSHLHFAVLKNNIFLDPLYYIAPPT